MPRRDDLSSVMVIGSGPIVIGQACEFDYSGTQGCKALRADGYLDTLIRELHAAGTTILLVEQNAQAALSVADRAYVLETGRISLTGTGAELMASDAVRKAYLGG